jgi:DNA-binding transcriptional LysR family regulator
MDLRQLEYFVAVAEEANFTRAAERVHISQSGVSAQLRRLERELGAELIDRSARTAALTVAGRAVLEHARAALASADAVRQAVDDLNGLVRGQVAVGMVTGCTVTPLFDAISAFRLAHPGIELGLVEDASDHLADRVRAGELDAALIGTAHASLPGLEVVTIISEPVRAAVPSDHPLAGRRRAKLADVLQHPVICMPGGTGIRHVLDDACAARGLRLSVALQASAPAAIADLAARGLGVAILSQSMLANHPTLKVLAISDLTSEAILALIYKPDPATALRELIDRCRHAFTPAGTERSAGLSAS